jgi:TonB family protein
LHIAVVPALILSALARPAHPQPTDFVLFDGRHLTAWKGVGKPTASPVVNGDAWTVAPADGWWLTNAMFKEHRARFEFRPAGTGPVRVSFYVRCHEEDNQPSVGYAVELELTPSKPARGHLRIVSRFPAGRGEVRLQKPGLATLGQLPADGWHRLDIQASGDRITAWTNGELLADARGGVTTRGHIALRADRGAIELRRISVRAVDRPLNTGGILPGDSPGVTLPRLLREVRPDYTREAMQAKVEGTVWVEAVVLTDGSVGDTQVVRSLDGGRFGLDQAAEHAARQWRFKPGTHLGQPVVVLVTIELKFTLR